jgi:hypothetical protein
MTAGQASDLPGLLFSILCCGVFKIVQQSSFYSPVSRKTSIWQGF